MLNGQVALVTGASRGIGEAIAARLAMEGARVVIPARTAEAGESKLSGTLHETLDRIRRAGGVASFIKADLSDAPPHLKMFFEVCNNHEGSFENGIVEALKPMPGEAIVPKNTMGAFASAPLGEVFDRLGVKTAVYVGVSTNNCVDTTAREAADRGYGSILVSDATGTCSDRMQEVTLESFQRLWGRVVTTEAAIGELAQSAHAKAA